MKYILFKDIVYILGVINMKNNNRDNNTEYMKKFNSRYGNNNEDNNGGIQNKNPYNGNQNGNNNRPPYNGNQNRNPNNRPPYNGNQNRNPQNGNNNNGNNNGNQNRNPNNNRPPYNGNNNRNPYNGNQNRNQYNRNQNTGDNYIKTILIDYIKRTLNLSNYKYKVIEFDFDLQQLKDKTYMVGPNYGGINGLLIFLKHEDKFLSYVIDKKFLTYNLDKVDYTKVKIIEMNYRLDESIYKGTIMDGVLLNDKIFVINDMYYFRGDDLTDDKIAHKLMNVSSYLNTNKIDSPLNDSTFIVNKLYKLDEIENLINVYTPQLPQSDLISGVSFYSEQSASKLIYLFNNATGKNESVVVENIINDVPLINNEYEIVENVETDNVSVETLTFKVRKTNINDVYNLYLGTILPNKIFKYNKIGIACIPTIESSFYVRNAFINNNNMDLLMDCKHDETKNVWIPMKINTDKKKPDLISKLDSFIQKTQQ
jgi:hypothetical protein